MIKSGYLLSKRFYTFQQSINQESKFTAASLQQSKIVSSERLRNICF